MGDRRVYWTQEDEDFLDEAWGIIPIPTIASKINKPQKRIAQKAYRMGLSAVPYRDDRLLLQEVLRLFKMGHWQSKQLNAWIEAGLDIETKTYGRTIYKMVSIDSIWIWVQNNPRTVNLSLLEPGILGKEPPWAKRRRQIDYINGQYAKRPWTVKEENRLECLARSGLFSVADLAYKFNRSYHSIDAKLRRMDFDISVLKPNSKNRTISKADKKSIMKLYDEGYCHHYIAVRLNKSACAVAEQIRRRRSVKGSNFDSADE